MNSNTAKTIAIMVIVITLGLVFPQLDPIAQAVIGSLVIATIIFGLIGAAFVLVNSHTAFKAKVGKSSAESRGSGVGALMVKSLDTDGINAVAEAETQRLDAGGKK